MFIAKIYCNRIIYRNNASLKKIQMKYFQSCYNSLSQLQVQFIKSVHIKTKTHPGNVFPYRQRIPDMAAHHNKNLYKERLIKQDNLYRDGLKMDETKQHLLNKKATQLNCGGFFFFFLIKYQILMNFKYEKNCVFITGAQGGHGEMEQKVILQ